MKARIIPKADSPEAKEALSLAAPPGAVDGALAEALPEVTMSPSIRTVPGTMLGTSHAAPFGKVEDLSPEDIRTADDTEEDEGGQSNITSCSVSMAKWDIKDENGIVVDSDESQERIKALIKLLPDVLGITSDDNGLYVTTKKGKKIIANCAVLNVVVLTDRSAKVDGQTARITIVNMKNHFAKTVEVTSEELKRADWINQKVSLMTNVENYKVFRSYINALLPLAGNNEVITKPGWNGNIFARYDDYLGEGEAIVRTYGKMKPVTNAVSATDEERRTAMSAVKTLLGCVVQSVAMQMMFFTLLLSFMASIFKRLQFARVPQYVLALIAVTQTGKTALLKALMSFCEKMDYFDISVGCSEAGIRKELEQYRDTTMVVDDLVDNNNKEALNNLNMITRLFGNAGSSHKNYNAEVSACGQVITAGEVEPILKKSSLNRMLFVHISKENLNFENITKMGEPETRALYAKAIADFITEIAKRGPDIVASELNNSFHDFEYRLNRTHKGLCQRRVEAYSWILAMEKFYREYSGDAENEDTALYDYAVNSLKEDYIKALYDMPEYEFCKTIVENTMNFQNISIEEPLGSDKWGYYTDDSFYIAETRVEKIRFLCDSPDTGKTALMKALIQRGILIPEQGRGHKWRLAVPKVGTIRTYRIDKKKAQDFISEIENN